MSQASVPDSHRDRRTPIPITIDRRLYDAPRDPMTGIELRNLAVPRIGPDRDLYLDERGGDGVLIGDDERVELHEGMIFFSVPKKINEG
jgi:hypothetical protein